MLEGRRGTILRIMKPLVAGLALAYLVTAFVDKPAPVHFQSENPYAAKQADIVEPQAEMVMDKNIMKLGSPLSVRPDEKLESEIEAPVVEIIQPEGGVIAPVEDEKADNNATSSIKGKVE